MTTFKDENPCFSYLKKNTYVNLGKAILPLQDMSSNLKSLITKKKVLNIENVPIEKLLYTKNELEAIASNGIEKKKLSSELKKFENLICNNCKNFNCTFCYEKMLYFQKIKRKTGKLSQGKYYNLVNNQFLLMTWLFCRLDQLQSSKLNFEAWFTKSKETALFKLGEAHGLFPSVFGNIVFFNWNSTPLFLNSNTEIQNPIVRGGGNLFLNETQPGFLCNNHRLVLDFIKVEFERNFKILPSLKSRTKSTQVENLSDLIPPKNFSANKETARFFSNFFSINPFFTDFTLKNPFFSLFNVVKDIRNLQPSFPEHLCVGITHIYKHIPEGLEINTEFQKKQVSSDQKNFPQRKRLSPSLNMRITPVTDILEETIGSQKDPLDKSIENENFSIEKKSYLPSFLPSYISTYLENYPLNTINKLFNIVISSKYDTNTLLNNTFPIQKILNNKKKEFNLKNNSLENTTLLHSLDGVCLNPSFLQSHTFLERFIENYPLKNQFDFIYFPSLAENLKNCLYYALFKEPSANDQFNFMLNKSYLDVSVNLNSILENGKFIQYYQEKKHKYKIDQIRNRVLELMKYFQLPTENSIQKLSLLDKFKFNEILNFIILESLILTELDYSLDHHKKVVLLENAFKETLGFKNENLFHSFSFNGKREISHSKIIDKLLFHFPVQSRTVCDDFFQLSIKNIETAFFYTSNVTKVKSSIQIKFPWEQ